MNKTFIPEKTENAQWYLLDAKNKTLGRLSTTIANILRGKNSIQYTPHMNPMTYIIVINAKHVKVTGKKKYQKTYKRHSGHPGGLKVENFNQLNNRIPNRIIEKAVKGMLPKGALARKIFTQLKVYSEYNHPHSAQKPEIIL